MRKCFLSQRQQIERWYLIDTLHCQVPFHTGANITIGKQYYCFLQYTKFIKSGWTILSTSQPETTLAATSGNISKLCSIVLVVSNFDQSGK